MCMPWSAGGEAASRHPPNGVLEICRPPSFSWCPSGNTQVSCRAATARYVTGFAGEYISAQWTSSKKSFLDRVRSWKKLLQATQKLRLCTSRGSRARGGVQSQRPRAPLAERNTSDNEAGFPLSVHVRPVGDYSWVTGIAWVFGGTEPTIYFCLLLWKTLYFQYFFNS